MKAGAVCFISYTIESAPSACQSLSEDGYVPSTKLKLRFLLVFVKVRERPRTKLCLRLRLASR